MMRKIEVHNINRHSPQDSKINLSKMEVNKRYHSEEKIKLKMRDRFVRLPTENAQRRGRARAQVVPESTPRLSPSSPGRIATIIPLRTLKTSPPSSMDKLWATSNQSTPQFPQSNNSNPNSIQKMQTLTSSGNAKIKSSRETDFQRLPEREKVQRRLKEFFRWKKAQMGMGRGSENHPAICDDVQTPPEIPDLGPYLLNLAKSTIASGDSPYKALDYAMRAAQSFEKSANGQPSLDLAMSLHTLAAIHCCVGQFEEAIQALKHATHAADEGRGLKHALAAFAGNMQLGDTFSLLSRSENALAAYHAALEIQKRALGDMDPRVGETSRYLAEAHVQAMQFEKAEELCQRALDIHKLHSRPASVEEATDRRLMGLICNGRGDYEAALEHLVLASMALIVNGKDIEVAAVDTSIGDTHVLLGRFDEAVFAYQKALTVFKSAKGENHASVAAVYANLAELYSKTGKLRDSRTYCETALRIYEKQGAEHPLDEVAIGLTEVAAVYESLNEHGQALPLLQKALTILDTAPGQQSAAAGVEAQIGILHSMAGKFAEACTAFRSAASKLKATAHKNSPFLGLILNQVGLACVQLHEIEEALETFEEARSILEEAYGPYHPDTLVVSSNLAGAYDAFGRLDDAINVLKVVVEKREETANPEVEEERLRLEQLLKEAGCPWTRRPNNTLDLLLQSKAEQANVYAVGRSNDVSVNPHTSTEIAA